jgi:hypothetical protein
MLGGDRQAVYAVPAKARLQTFGHAATDAPLASSSRSPNRLAVRPESASGVSARKLIPSTAAGSCSRCRCSMRTRLIRSALRVAPLKPRASTVADGCLPPRSCSSSKVHALMPAARATSQPHKVAISRRAAKPSAIACSTRIGNSSRSTKCAGKIKRRRRSGKSPSARARSVAIPTPRRCARPARGSRKTRPRANTHQSWPDEPDSVPRVRVRPATACRGDAAVQPSVETGLLVTGKCQPLCGERCWRQRRLWSKTLLGTAVDDALEQRRSAAEETQRCGHFKQQHSVAAGRQISEVKPPAQQASRVKAACSRSTSRSCTARSGRNAQASASRNPGSTPADVATSSATTTRSRLTMALGDDRPGKTSSGRRGRCRTSQSMTETLAGVEWRWTGGHGCACCHGA